MPMHSFWKKIAVLFLRQYLAHLEGMKCRCKEGKKLVKNLHPENMVGSCQFPERNIIRETGSLI